MKPIKEHSRQELQDLMKSLGQPRFRVAQLVQWLYARGAQDYDEMTDFSKDLRKRLDEVAPLYTPMVVETHISTDGTRKYLIEFHDGQRVETVAIPSRDSSNEGDARRLTVCVSTQVGCAMDCTFCATGKEGFTRNLVPGEIIDQIHIAQADTGIRANNVVTMGQGEPFLNYDNTLEALRFANSSQGLEIGARHITMSTCGILEGIQKLSQEPEQFTLAVSLHSAVQETRNQVMPRVANQTLNQLKPALRSYVAATNRRVSLEYIMIDEFNDTQDELKALKSFCKGLHCHVNLLTLNSVDGSSFKPSSKANQKYWVSQLEAVGVAATIRDSRGGDIAGACGQLKSLS